MSRVTRGALLVGLFALHALPFLNRPRIIGGDEPYYALMASSIATDGDFDLREDYERVARGSNAAGAAFASVTLEPHLASHGTRTVFSHPLGMPLLVAPLLRAWNLMLPRAAPDWLLGGLSLAITYLAIVAGWQILAAACGSRRHASLLIFALYLSTPL